MQEYIKGRYTKQNLTKKVIMQNKGNLWVAFHEIAQIHIANRLADAGQEVKLEYPIKSKQKNWLGMYKRYEADIVDLDSNLVWEVKPILGKDPKRQLELYTREGGLTRGPIMKEINDIPITKNIKMKVTFPRAGEARYSFYREQNGNKVDVKSTVVKKEVEEEYFAVPEWLKFLVPGLQGGFAPVPVIP